MARAAARCAPEAHFLLVSSLSARAPQLSPYAASKAAGEAAVRAALAPGRLTIVRPPAIYGPGDRETFALFQAAASLPALPVPGPAGSRFALIHAADAGAQIAALAARPADARVWALADDRPEGYGWREILQAAAQAVGRRRPLLPIPPALVTGIGAAGTLLNRLGGEPRIFSLGKARELLHADWGLASNELAPDLPAPRFGLADGFSDVVRWYRANGWLKGQAVPRTSPGG
jgi:nucleoside-diphosphate-sugar epimerase